MDQADESVGQRQGGPMDQADESVGQGQGGPMDQPDESDGQGQGGPMDQPDESDGQRQVRGPIDQPDKSVGPTGSAGDGIASFLERRRHHLPHWQIGGSVYFITFRSARGGLSAESRLEVVKTIHYDDGRRYQLYLAVVMPDHVHMLIQPKRKKPGIWFDLAEIMKSIKGVSARRINLLLRTEGAVWQPESFDRIIRNEDEFLEKWNYMLNNPLKSGLAERPEDYKYTLIGRPDTPVGQG
jgi:putative transposase